jgi:hypothetical protein
MMTTLYPYQQTFGPIIERPRQGRSKKKLRAVVKSAGRVFVARFQGRQGRFFGATPREAHDNLQAGGQ